MNENGREMGGQGEARKRANKKSLTELILFPFAFKNTTNGGLLRYNRK
jgi:hypothetical protein